MVVPLVTLYFLQLRGSTRKVVAYEHPTSNNQPRRIDQGNVHGHASWFKISVCIGSVMGLVVA